MKKVRLLVSAAIAAGCIAAFAPAASAAGQVCYSVHVAAQGGDVVNESGCVPLP